MIGVSSRKQAEARNGKWKEFNKHAVLVAEGCYVNNLKHGHWKEYYDTGDLMIEEYYDHGIQHGLFRSYHPGGKLFSEGTYHRGRREGYFRIYDEQNRNVRNILFINNNLVEDLETKNTAEPTRTIDR